MDFFLKAPFCALFRKKNFLTYFFPKKVYFCALFSKKCKCVGIRVKDNKSHKHLN